MRRRISALFCNSGEDRAAEGEILPGIRERKEGGISGYTEIQGNTEKIRKTGDGKKG